ncbi:hypothetical protein [Streptococcus suis]|uniref:hypothetical protein n=1 Tax=Streptococcus suis TaxID=1307 RepID=UPI0005CDAE2A|nr:hypothetical protein [Streptococcus suis]NQI05877.1 hypothetical protein [Streptococcus suis]CYU09480.1 Uncharacterised protein [Streptococcus suis]HEL2401538.1 hypothetical protein [Streptococcus suis]HEM2740576.1 hypothetical protein [Streptococcus suis]
MREQIKTILNEVKELIEGKKLETLGIEFKKIDGEYFEKVFQKYCQSVLERDEFNEFILNDIRGHKFPDFSIEKDGSIYGVEIKSSEKGNWTIPGNSVYENTPTTNFEDIFVFFGSYKENVDSFEVRITEYWKAVKDIKVTHSPRFEISVNPEIETDFFESWDAFATFKQKDKDEKTKLLQDFLKEKKAGQNLWYVPVGEEQAEPMLFEKLEKEVQNEILAKCFILFPSEIFKAKSTGEMDSDYKDVTRFLLEEYFVYSPSMRDKFSSGGKKGLEQDNEPPKFPAVFKRFAKLGNQIHKILQGLDQGDSGNFKELLLTIWNQENSVIRYDGESFVTSYKSHLNNLENSPNLQYVIRKELKELVDDTETNFLSSKISQ